MFAVNQPIVYGLFGEPYSHSVLFTLRVCEIGKIAFIDTSRLNGSLKKL